MSDDPAKPAPDDTEKLRPPLDVNVTYQGRQFRQDLRFQAYIHGDVDGVNNDMSENPARFAQWAYLEAKAKSALEEALAELEACAAELFLLYMDQLTERGEKGKSIRPALDVVKSRVTINPKRREIERRVRKLKEHCDLLAVGRKTIEHRKEALITVAANMRAEMDGKLIVNKSDARKNWERRQG